jgi:hypothetical protein
MPPLQTKQTCCTEPRYVRRVDDVIRGGAHSSQQSGTYSSGDSTLTLLRQDTWYTTQQFYSSAPQTTQFGVPLEITSAPTAICVRERPVSAKAHPSSWLMI